VTAFANFEGETNEAGLKHGWGKLTWDDGESFEGQFENDEKVKGTFKWATGDVYEGEWHKDVMHGQGTYNYVDGRKYSGGWEYGCRHGAGTFLWPNGDKYEGEFVKDQCHGIGVHTYADEKQYKGEWLDNKKHGYGILTYPRGEKTEEGSWEHNLLCGATIFTDTEGKRYEEVWKDGARIGARKPLKRDASAMAQLAAATKAPEWANDNNFAMCYKCNDPFTFVNRRHHCRNCGLVFCDRCTSQKIKVAHGTNPPSVKPERVCDECLLLTKVLAVQARFDAVQSKLTAPTANSNK